MSKEKLKIAETFGRTLDQDDFDGTAKLLAKDCIYIIGSKQLKGPMAICASYESNMIEGRKKLDDLQWGASTAEEIDANHYLVHFTDYLRHNRLPHTHKCSQQLTILENKITEIKHIPNPEEEKKLKTFYKKVGLL
ncbi:hypothetical protein GYB22_00940 [bacterium]|nr:hypothetical protein [bacterium]